MTYPEAKQLSGGEGKEHWVFTRWDDQFIDLDLQSDRWKRFCRRLKSQDETPSPVNEARLEIAAFDLVTSVEEYTDVGDVWEIFRKVDDILATDSLSSEVRDNLAGRPDHPDEGGNLSYPEYDEIRNQANEHLEAICRKHVQSQ